MTAVVVAVSCSGTHSMSKPAHEAIKLLAGLGVEGDAHLGTTVQHLYPMRRDPTQPNLRQVHLIHAELHEELRAAGFALKSAVRRDRSSTRSCRRRRSRRRP